MCSESWGRPCLPKSSMRPYHPRMRGTRAACSSTRSARSPHRTAWCWSCTSWMSCRPRPSRGSSASRTGRRSTTALTGRSRPYGHGFLRSGSIGATCEQSSGSRPSHIADQRERRHERDIDPVTDPDPLDLLRHRFESPARETLDCLDDHTLAALADGTLRSEEHTSELQSHVNLVCRLLL